MSFLRLPAELQIHVFSYNSVPELKNARAVCTKFRDHASMWLFRTVVACARYQATGAFQHLSEHAVYAKYVKEIIFDGTTYDPELARNEYIYQQSANQFEELRGIVSWERRNRFRKYKELCNEQQDILDGHVLLQTLARALEWRLPSVSSLVYSPEPHQIPVEKKHMKEILPRGPRRFSEGTHDGFHHLIGAIYISQYSGIQNFTIGSRPVDLPREVGADFHIDVFRFRKADHIEAGRYFFQHLKKIDIVLAPSSRFTRGGPVEPLALECLANLAALLAAAKDLENLSFGFSGWQFDSQVHGSMASDGRLLSHVGLTATWPSLRCLTLGGIYAKEEEFKELVARYKETLKSLKFHACGLFAGKWSNIVDEVVFGTSIARFCIGGVGEDSTPWEYEGFLEITDEGERLFREPADRSVYRWRDEHQSMDES